MMNHFQPSKSHLGSIIMSSSSSTLFFFFFVLIAPAVAASRENPLVELSSSADLIELAGYGEQKVSTVVVSGTLLCSSCSNGRTSHHLQRPHPVQGGSVAVSCHATRKMRKSNWVRGTTDEYGEFFLDLPSHLHAIPNLEKKCIVKVLQLPRNSPCHHSFTGQHKGLKLLSSGNGGRVYTTEGIHITPKPSQPCIHRRRRGKKMTHSH